MNTSSFLTKYEAEFAHRLGERKEGFRFLFQQLEAKSKRRYNILETGSVRHVGNWEGDGQSTILFDSFINFHDGMLFSIDLNVDSTAASRRSTSAKTHCICSDSVRFIKDLGRLSDGGLRFDLLYLDSFDVDFSNPAPSSFHHIKEILAMGTTVDGLIVAIDDNIEIEGKLIGKGGMAYEYFSDLGIDPIYRGYQLIWQL